MVFNLVILSLAGNTGVAAYGIVANLALVVAAVFTGIAQGPVSYTHLEEAWDFRFGRPFTGETQQEILKALEPGYINGLTLLGGEPFEPENQRALLPFLRQVRERFPEKDIWCYTGYLFDAQDVYKRQGCG